MSEDNKSIEFTLGQLSGKLDGILGSMNTISSTFASHSLSDDHNFNELRKRMEEDKKEATLDRIRVARYVGGMMVLLTILSYVVPTILGKIIHF